MVEHKTSDERLQKIIAQREAGVQYNRIAANLGISLTAVRRRLMRAIDQGLITPEQIHYRPGTQPSRIAPEGYDQHILERIKRRVTIDENGFWLWNGTKTPTGYGTIDYKSSSMNVHRAAYQAHFRVKLETEQYVLHRCDVRNCCNPDHLWIGTAKDNNADCAAKGRHYEGSREVCERGHPFSGDNLRLGTQKGGRSIRRICVTCERLRAKGLV